MLRVLRCTTDDAKVTWLRYNRSEGYATHARLQRTRQCPEAIMVLGVFNTDFCFLFCFCMDFFFISNITSIFAQEYSVFVYFIYLFVWLFIYLFIDLLVGWLIDRSIDLRLFFTRILSFLFLTHRKSKNV